MEEAEPHPYDPVLTEAGVPLPTVEGAVPPDEPDDDALYDIEKVLRAEKIGNKFRLWIKWVGYDEPSPMWRADLVSQPLSDELLNEIEEACQRYRDEHRKEEEEPEELLPDASPSQDITDPSLPARRPRKQTDHYTPSMFMYIDNLNYYIVEELL